MTIIAIVAITIMIVKRAITALDAITAIIIITFISLTIAIEITTTVKNCKCHKYPNGHTAAKVIMTTSLIRTI